MTGDGARDRISLTGRWTQKGCKYRLRVQGSAPLRLREGLLESPDIHPSARQARLVGLAQIDRRPGAEVLISIGPANPRGEEVGVYGFASGRLRHLPVTGPGRDDTLFFSGGNGPYWAVVDCWRGPRKGLVVSSSASWDTSAVRVDVTRRLYRVEDGVFEPVWTRRYHRLRKNPFPEFRGSGSELFRSCKMRG